MIWNEEWKTVNNLHFCGGALLYFIFFIYFFSYTGPRPGWLLQWILRLKRSTSFRDGIRPLTIWSKQLSTMLRLTMNSLYTMYWGVHTYMTWADSDSLAAKIDSLGLPAKSPVVVYGDWSMICLRPNCSLDQVRSCLYSDWSFQLSLERVAAIVEVAEPSRCSTDFLWVTVPNRFNRITGRSFAQTAYEILILSREMIVSSFWV